MYPDKIPGPGQRTLNIRGYVFTLPFLYPVLLIKVNNTNNTNTIHVEVRDAIQALFYNVPYMV